MQTAERAVSQERGRAAELRCPARGLSRAGHPKSGRCAGDSVQSSQQLPLLSSRKAVGKEQVTKGYEDRSSDARSEDGDCSEEMHVFISGSRLIVAGS